jgi:hypothetical protein
MVNIPSMVILGMVYDIVLSTLITKTTTKTTRNGE